MDLNRELSDYAIAITTYEGTHQLPSSFFERPDHLAIKTAGIKQFEEVVKSLGPEAQQMTCIEQEDGRFRVAAKILGALSLGVYGRVNWLEVIEDESFGIDHSEFVYEDFSRLRDVFERKRVEYEIEAKDGHRSASVRFSGRGHIFGFRISDTPVSAIVEEEIQNGEAYIIAA